ncbi:hypothetical protein XENTR_v10007269 [Xenopus tropicalis]|nr:hypothetical protein XENTR_v10007269 [Xenopus tropicalis]
MGGGCLYRRQSLCSSWEQRPPTNRGNVPKIQSLSSVRSLVGMQSRLALETLPAFRARKWPLSRVDPPMRQVVPALLEGFAAVTAHKGFLPGVNPLMDDESGLVPETLAAVRTGERFLLGVNPLVYDQVGLLAQAFAAHQAHVAFLLRRLLGIGRVIK